MTNPAVVVTVLNEAESITQLLKSLQRQTLPPSKIIIVDGGSTDGTAEKITQFNKKSPPIPTEVIQKKGNRSVGRNTAIKEANNNEIAITDAGCIPEKRWLEELVEKRKKTGADVIAGYYKGLPTTPFEEAVVPYVLVMPDKVKPEDFLPATRSMLITKKIWQKAGGFDKALSDNEDYAFARRLKERGAKIVFAPKAVVGWLPRSNFREFYTMIFRFARGDIFAGIVRPKVILLFFRYLVGFLLVVAGLIFSIPELIQLLAGLLLLYFFWAIVKNFRYVEHGWYWLPVLQVVSDIAVMHGSVAGLLQRKLIQ